MVSVADNDDDDEIASANNSIEEDDDVNVSVPTGDGVKVHAIVVLLTRLFFITEVESVVHIELRVEEVDGDNLFFFIEEETVHQEALAEEGDRRVLRRSVSGVVITTGLAPFRRR